MRRLTIGIDFRPALSRMTGVGRYVSGLIEALGRLDSVNDYLLFSSSYRERVERARFPPNFRLVDRRIPVRLLNLAWHRLASPSLDMLTGRAVDLTHSPHPLILPSRRGKSIVTIHDLFFFRHPELTAAEIRRDYAPLVQKHARRADAVIAVSETTASDVEEELGIPRERIAVVTNGFDRKAFSPHPEEEERIASQYSLETPFILTVATFEPRKNLPRLLEALGHLVEGEWDGCLVLAGGGGMDEPKVDEAIERHRLSNRVKKLGYVPPQHLPAIYRRAKALVNPSLWEGFGLPLLEAMCSKTPIVASDIPAHREVAGDAAYYVTPDDPASIASGIQRVLDDDSLRRRLKESGAKRVERFSWEETARQTLGVYRRVSEIS